MPIEFDKEELAFIRKTVILGLAHHEMLPDGYEKMQNKDFFTCKRILEKLIKGENGS